MDTLLNLRAFVTTAREGNFSRAARHLNTVPSVVSKRIAQLEWELGAPLFERSTRRMMLTEQGRRLQARAGTLLGQFDELASSLSGDAGGLQGGIRLKMPPSIGVAFLSGMLAEFQIRHAHITLDVLLVDRPVNPIEERVDIAIAGSDAIYEGVTDVALCPLRQMLCASPAYLRGHGVPSHPDELVDHDCLVFAPMGQMWEFDGPRGAVGVEVSPRLMANDYYTLLAGARAGAGVAILPTYLARQAADYGILVPLMRDYPLRERWLKALVPSHRLAVPRVQALITWIQDALGETPPWDR